MEREEMMVTPPRARGGAGVGSGTTGTCRAFSTTDRCRRSSSSATSALPAVSISDSSCTCANEHHRGDAGRMLCSAFYICGADCDSSCTSIMSLSFCASTSSACCRRFGAPAAAPPPPPPICSSRRRDCHSAALPSPFSRCFNRDKESLSLYLRRLTCSSCRNAAFWAPALRSASAANKPELIRARFLQRSLHLLRGPWVSPCNAAISAFAPGRPRGAPAGNCEWVSTRCGTLTVCAAREWGVSNSRVHRSPRGVFSRTAPREGGARARGGEVNMADGRTAVPFRVRVQLHDLQTIRGDQGHLILTERIVPQSEVRRAIVLEDSPCGGGSRTCACIPNSSVSATCLKFDTPIPVVQITLTKPRVSAGSSSRVSFETR